MMFYFYSLFIDPILRSLRKQISELVPEGSSVIEIACGTGNQTLILAEKVGRITGIDLNRQSIDRARKKIPHRHKDTVTFRAADGRKIHFSDDKDYDIATITLALHEMDEDVRLPVLTEMKRVAKRLIIADYASPLPHNQVGRITVLIEKLAGKRHYAGFRNYQNNGGLDSLLKKAGITYAREYTVLEGSIRVLDCPLSE